MLHALTTGPIAALAKTGTLAAVLTLVGCGALTAPAQAYSARVEDACSSDYFRHCAGYPLGSASLRLCMESKSKQLSQTCIRALIDAGEVDRRRVRRGT